MMIYSGIFPLNMVIFHSYVNLPEGNQFDMIDLICYKVSHWFVSNSLVYCRSNLVLVNQVDISIIRWVWIMLFLGCTTLYMFFPGHGRILQDGKLQVWMFHSFRQSHTSLGPIYGVHPIDGEHSSEINQDAHPSMALPRDWKLFLGRSCVGESRITQCISSTYSASSQVAARNHGAAPNGSIRCSLKFPHITWLYLQFSLFYPILPQFLLEKNPCPTCHPEVMLKLAITHLRSCYVGILWTATASRHFWNRVEMPFRSNL